ncbi:MULTISPECIES: hypothetical protein [Achromobacter]|uniref:hypothetical protein n=1 Tax=Achromobacter TaxID=222 RepID=UPI0023F9F95A|nr:hypothetical protein [Achromobacter anxifer]MDF8364658.1 hypothetical protein [Achromobacter anxifer]
MAILHILQPRDAAGQVLSGLFGTIEASENSSLLNFKADPALARCSATLTALQRQLQARPDEVVTIEADEDTIRALKANMGRALQLQWNRRYEQVIGPDTADTGAGMQAEDEGARLVAIPGMGSINRNLLQQALQVERQIANEGIEALVAATPDVATVWVDVQLRGAYIGYEQERTVGYVSRTDQCELNYRPLPVWGEFDHAEYSPTKARGDEPNEAEAERGEVGFFDVKAAIPVYVPISPAQAPSFQEGQLATQAPKAFSFGGSQQAAPQQAPRPQAIASSAPTTEQVQRVMELVWATPILRQMIVDWPTAKAIDFSSRVPTELNVDAEFCGADEEDDYDEDGDRAFPAPRA